MIKSKTTNEIIGIRQKDLVEKVSQEIYGVIHTVALHGKYYEQNYPREEFIKTNIEGTFNLLLYL